MSEQMRSEISKVDRAKRVKYLKKAIVLLLLMMILIPTVLCIFLFFKMHKLETKINDLLQVRAMQEEQVISEELTSKLESEPIKRIEKQEDSTTQKEAMEAETKVYLTFDDGPSIYTDEILDILKEYDVKATFFVVGKEEEQYKRLYQRIVAEGHTLGLHSFSHKYWEIYESINTFANDINRLQEFLLRTTGVKPHILRFPGGSSNTVSSVDMEEIIAYVGQNGLTYYDWNISSGDAANRKLNVQTIVNNCTNQLEKYHTAVILMHDAQDKRTTVEALPIVIQKILEQENTAILPITDETEPIQHIKEKEKQ